MSSPSGLLAFVSRHASTLLGLLLLVVGVFLWWRSGWQLGLFHLWLGVTRLLIPRVDEPIRGMLRASVLLAAAALTGWIIYSFVTTA